MNTYTILSFSAIFPSILVQQRKYFFTKLHSIIVIFFEILLNNLQLISYH